MAERQNEIPNSAPLVTAGKRTCALYERVWLDNKGTTHRTLTLAEVKPAKTERLDDGRVVVTEWRREFKGINLGIDDREGWIRFVEDINAAFARGIQQRLGPQPPHDESLGRPALVVGISDKAASSIKNLEPGTRGGAKK